MLLSHEFIFEEHTEDTKPINLDNCYLGSSSYMTIKDIFLRLADFMYVYLFPF